MIRTLFAATLLFFASTCTGEETDQYRFRSPQDVVDQLYRDFAWEAIMPPKPGTPSLAFQSKTVLNKYFDRELVALLMADANCARKTATICALDFDPIFASQDSSASDLEIQQEKESIVHVKFLYPSTREWIALDFETQKTPAGWRIKDIHYKNELATSLKKILGAFHYR